MLRRSRDRKPDDGHPYLILDARYETVRLDGVIQTQTVLTAMGSTRTAVGRCSAWRCPIGNRVQAGRPSSRASRLAACAASSFLADDHAGFKRAVAELLPQGGVAHTHRTTYPARPTTICRHELRWLFGLGYPGLGYPVSGSTLVPWAPQHHSIPTVTANSLPVYVKPGSTPA